jgi:hypothetical protein
MVKLIDDSIYIPLCEHNKYSELFIAPYAVDTETEREVDWILKCYGKEDQ